MPIAFGDDRLPARFWAKVQISDNGCWTWTASRNADNYGNFSVDGQAQSAHRVAYLALIGSISDEQQVDHQCHNRSDCPGGKACEHRACVNPAHLDLTTRAVNQLRSRHTWSGAGARRTHCAKGHEYTPDNTITRANGGRSCRACSYARVAKYEKTEGARAKRQAAREQRNAGRPPNQPRTHCKRGHELTEDNLYHSKGERICKTCHKMRAKKWLANNPAAVERKLERTREWRERNRPQRASSSPE